MARNLNAVLRAALLATALLAAPVASDESKASLTAALSLSDPATGAPVDAAAGEPVRLTVELTDAVSGLPPRGLDLFGWVRPVEAGNSTCEQAAQAFRATRRIPMGSSDLNGILVTTLNRDGSIGVIDPKLNLHSSNMLAAHRFEAMPDALAIDRRQMRALLTFPGEGRIAALSLMTGGVTDFARGLPAPADIATASTGDVWVASSSDGSLRRLGGDGTEQAVIDLGKGAVSLRRQPDDETDLIGAFTSQGALLLVDGTSGRQVLRIDAGQPVADATFLGDQAAMALIDGQAEARLYYADAPDAPVIIPTGAVFTRLASGPDARIAVAYTPGASTFALIDTALGRVVQPAALSDATVAEVAFTDNAAFLLSHDGGFVGAVDLATVGLGKPAVIRNVNLGARAEAPPPGAALLTPLFPSPRVLAVEPANQTGWVIGEVASSVEMPPMESIRLRGGVPHIVRVVDRSFDERAPGRFETVWAFGPGEHELVLTTGIAGLSTCIPFSVSGERAAQRLTPVTMRADPEGGPIRAGEVRRIAIRLADADGQPLALDELPIRLPAMQSSWSGSAVARREADGVLRAEIRLPHAGVFVVQPVNLPPGMALRSAAIVEVEPKDQ